MNPIRSEGLMRGMQRLHDRPHDSHTAPDEPVPLQSIQYHHELVGLSSVLEQEEGQLEKV